ncbi:coiled-coil domain containing 94 [Capsaspora owczarzaki ATCC 30864]|uniref:Splicing factor YJU2 n=1 Tax=Capsaspora owczarzaki (strain ATCC 30864) TaxID=595528 RepID=A0A0D2X5Q3_CAPO3|nr:coiled-coil domain containing 94 [Capsaspora owczarzaki ATCC 30864]KJE98209.1 coiled-coil domain containing 94 [Capsaspora owczarzaki ATCC 30864]|eukprot:XP_004342462.2 coiled-coil domain containing 94 [Capsaspora owczarzaki ATCC 30864]
MAERKVLNKYYPPDFDPSKLPRQQKKAQCKVRLMAPCNMWCNVCGNYIYKGLKFNARKETVAGESYLGIKVFRFYIRCPRCASECTFKTDPEHSDYVAEINLTRNLEPWREKLAREDEERKKRLADEEDNPMKALENRTLDSRREMELIEALEDIRDTNARHGRVDHNAMLDHYAKLQQQDLERQELEDETLVQNVFRKGAGAAGSLNSGPGGVKRRLAELQNSNGGAAKSALDGLDSEGYLNFSDDDDDDEDDDADSGIVVEDGLANVFSRAAAGAQPASNVLTGETSAAATHDAKRPKIEGFDAGPDKLIATGVTKLVGLVKKKTATTETAAKPAAPVAGGAASVSAPLLATSSAKPAPGGLSLLGGYASDDDE